MLRKRRSANYSQSLIGVVFVSPDTVLKQDSDCQERILPDEVVEGCNPAISLGTDIVVSCKDDLRSQGLEKKVGTRR